MRTAEPMAQQYALLIVDPAAPALQDDHYSDATMEELPHFGDEVEHEPEGATEPWVLLAFLIVVGIALWQKVPAMIGSMLDKRAAGVRTQLDEARAIREEAQSLLAEYQRRQRDAEEEAKGIVEQAKADAKAMAAEARTKLDDQLARRKKAAEDRIARAEAQAVAEMRGKTADLAVAAARDIISSRVDDRAQTALIDRAISDLRGKLH